MTVRARTDLSGDVLTMAGAGARIEFDLSLGTFSLPNVLRGARAHVELADGTVESSAAPWVIAGRPARFEDAHGRGVRAVMQSGSGGLRLSIEICVYDAQPFVLLRLGVENPGRTQRRLRSLSPLDGVVLFATPRRWRWFRHGWQSWSPALSLSVVQQDIASAPPVLAPEAPLEGPGHLAADEVAALLDPDSGRVLLAGFISARSQWTQVRLDATRRTIRAAAFADDKPLIREHTVWSERLLIEVASDAAPAFEDYASALAREMGARVPPAPPVGWCSWYYYFTTVTEADVLENLRFLEQHRDVLPVQHVQIDDGYQAGIGDWTIANDKFPHGMAWLAREVRDAGFTPGLWLAPVLAGERSRLVAEHPEWLVASADGRPALAMRNWDQDCYGLDGTRPRVLDWLRALFREITEGWGYDYVKIDFLFGAAIAGRRHEAAATRIEAYRGALQAIRDGADDRFVLGCGALMGASVGLIDAQRIGPDVAPWWRFRRSRMPPAPGRPPIGGEPATENALRNVLTRAWMHNQLWANDPDCLLARDARTKLALAEVQSLATAIAMSGGAVFLSDDLPRLSRARLDLVSALLPPLGDAPVARDLLREEMPSRFELDVRRPSGSCRLVAAFNWLRKRQLVTVPLPPGRWHAFEFWSERYLGARSGRVRIDGVPAHGVVLLALRRVRERPQLVGTTLHYSMGAREVASERWDARTLSLRIALRPVAKKEGAVAVSVPRGYRCVSAMIGGEPIEVKRAAGWVAAPLALRRPATLLLRFTRSRSRTP